MQSTIKFIRLISPVISTQFFTYVSIQHFVKFSNELSIESAYSNGISEILSLPTDVVCNADLLTEVVIR